MKPKRPMKLAPKDAARFWSKVEAGGVDDCWPFRTARSSVYGQFMGFVSHRVAYFLHYGIDPGDQIVCHSCDNPPCCNPAHLFLGDYKINKQDCVAKKRHRHKLSDEAIRQVQEMLADGMTHQAIADAVGIARYNVQSVKDGHIGLLAPPSRPPARIWGRNRSGERNGHARLTADQVLIIRKRIAAGDTNAAIAAEYGVRIAAISKIATGRNWKSVDMGDFCPQALDRLRIGERNPMAKLTADQVRAIRVRLAEGASQETIAREFGVSRGAIRGIQSGKHWSHLT